MTEAQVNELADMITDVAISYANGHATDFRIAAKAAVAFVLQSSPPSALTSWQDAFNERHEFDVYPDHFMTGMRNEFAAGWHAALKASPPAPPRISESDTAYWIANRAAIIDAISKAGFKLMSNRNGFWLLNVQDDEPQTNEDAQ